MKTNRKKSIEKGIIDISMILFLLACVITTSVFEEKKIQLSNGANPEQIYAWGTSHCIISVIFVAFIGIHIWQHWNFFKSFFSKKLYKRNKITTITILVFIVTVISFLLYFVGFTFTTLHIHSLFAHIFIFIVIVHFIVKFKQLRGIFRI